MEEYYMRRPRYEEAMRFLREDLTGPVDPNVYVPLGPRCWVPLFYRVATIANTSAILKELWPRANIRLRADAECPLPISLRCHETNLPLFLEEDLSGYDLTTIIRQQLTCANYERIFYLHRLGRIPTLVFPHDGDFYCQALQTLIKYLNYCFLARTDEIENGAFNITDEVNRVISQYRDMFENLLRLCPCPRITGVQEIIVEFYLHEFVDLFPGSYPEIVYHDHQNALKVALNRPLINDGRYVRLCQALQRATSPALDCNTLN